MEWNKVREILETHEIKEIIQEWYNDAVWEKRDVEAFNLAMEKLGLPKVEIDFDEEDDEDAEEDEEDDNPSPSDNLRPDPAKIDYCTPCTYKSCSGCEVPATQRTKRK